MPATIPPQPRGIKKAKLDRWTEFTAWMDKHSDSSWVFRGLGDARFALIPGAGRVDNYSLALERTSLDIFERRANEFIDASRLSEWDKMAVAQHHGLPTRLLDWTTNPLIAAYFAVSANPGFIEILDTKGMKHRVVPDQANVQVRIIAFRVRSSVVIDPVRDPDPFKRTSIGFVLPRSVTARIVNQSGLFSCHPDPSVPWEDPLSAPKHLFDIDGSMRSFFRRRLFYLGVDAQRIMGGLDGIGGRLAWQFNAKIGMGAVR